MLGDHTVWTSHPNEKVISGFLHILMYLDTLYIIPVS